MPLALTVLLLVAAVTAVTAVAGYLIDVSARREEGAETKRNAE